MAAREHDPVVRVSQLPSPRFRKRVKTALVGLRAGLWGRGAWVERALARPRVQFLCLHHVFEDETARFRELLRWITTGHEIATYSAAAGLLRATGPLRPTVALSFDDGFKNHLTAAAILEEFGCRGMFFLCTDALDAAGDAVASARVCRQMYRRPAIELLTWDDAAALVARGHEIGCHTCSHPDLAAMPPGAALDEIERSAEALRRRLGPVKHFAWPFGRWVRFNQQLAKAVFDAGFQTAASAEVGAHVSTVDSERSLCIRREPIEPSWPPGHVRYRLAHAAHRASENDNRWPDGWSP